MNVAPTVRFSEQDLAVFSRASGDRNPLHLSSDYASRTAYGQQVVFGALGCLACLGSVSRRDGRVTRLVADFHRPMFLNVDYRRESVRSGESVVARLFDGSVPVLTTTMKFSASEAGWQGEFHEAPAQFPTHEAQELGWSDLHAGGEVAGSYRVDAGALRELYTRWSLDVQPSVSEAMLWSSYLIGMEMPGKTALFFRAAIDFREEPRENLPFDFRATVTGLNSSLQQMKCTVELTSRDAAFASGQLTSFVRPEVPRMRFSELTRNVGAGLAGKVAVVLGASRGLGAALVMALASAGAQVVAVARSEAPWKSDLPRELAGQVTFLKMDAGDSEQMSLLAAHITREFGRLDFLVCSAFPAIPPYRLEPSAATRIQTYIHVATQMVLAPLCALLPQLSTSNGCTVLISSVAVEQPVRDWPHYVAAKSAAESICRVAPMQFPETSTLIVRPDKLLTEMTNTPMGRRGAASPEILAGQIVSRLRQPPAAGTCEWFDFTGKLAVREALAQ